MVAARAWINAAADTLAADLGAERALRVAQRLAAIPGANKSAAETLRMLVAALEVAVGEARR